MTWAQVPSTHWGFAAGLPAGRGVTPSLQLCRCQPRCQRDGHGAPGWQQGHVQEVAKERKKGRKDRKRNRKRKQKTRRE